MEKPESSMQLVTWMVLVLFVLMVPTGAVSHPGEAVDDTSPNEDTPEKTRSNPPLIRSGHFNHMDIPVSYAISALDEQLRYAWDVDHNLGQDMVIDDPIFAGEDWKRTTIYGADPAGNWIFSRCYMQVPVEPMENVRVLNASLSLTTDYHPDSNPENLKSFKNITLTVPLSINPVLQYWDASTIGSGTNIQDMPSLDEENNTGELVIGHRPDSVRFMFDVTPFVDDWISGNTNNGICLRGPEEREMGTMPEEDEFFGIYENDKKYAFGTNYFHGVGSGEYAPNISVDYLLNRPPEVSITSPSAGSVKQGTPLSFTGEAVDPDGDGIDIYEWSSDVDGLLAIGPDKTRLDVNNLTVGLHHIRLRVRDDLSAFPRWSEYAWQTVRILSNVPEVTEVLARREGESVDRFEFDCGDTVVFNVTVSGGIGKLSGRINITYSDLDKQLVNEDTMSASDNVLTYSWNTKGVAPDTYRIDVVVWDFNGATDTDGLFGPEPDLEITLVDRVPPIIKSLDVTEGTESNAYFEIGDTVTITAVAEDSESGLSASLEITDQEGRSVMAGGMKEGDWEGNYVYDWNTQSLESGGVFNVRVTLTDISGNSNFGDIQLTVYDTNAPVVSMVSAQVGSQEGDNFPVATTIRIVVTELSQEEELEGVITMMFKNSFLIYEEPMEEMGNGQYIYTWNTADLEAGFYSINVTLLDEDGNRDPDGLGKLDAFGNRAPDLVVRLTVPPAVLVVTQTFPMPGSRDISTATMMVLHFSQPVDPESVSADTVLIFEEDETPVTGEFHINDAGTTLVFDPTGHLPPESIIQVMVSDGVTSPEDIPATPYLFAFKTGAMSGQWELAFSPESRRLSLNGGEVVDFEVDFVNQMVDREELTVIWSLDDDRVAQDNLSFSFEPGPNMTGTHLIEVMVIHGEETFIENWTVSVPQFVSGGVDKDGDELPDSWEIARFGTLDMDGDADPDGDGITNRRELDEGTDPMERIERSDNTVIIAALGVVLAIALVLNILVYLRGTGEGKGNVGRPKDAASVRKDMRRGEVR